MIISVIEELTSVGYMPCRAYKDNQDALNWVQQNGYMVKDKPKYRIRRIPLVEKEV